MNNFIAPYDQSSIYLIGFMGTGKSTVGTCLAKTLGYAFIDSDVLFFAQTGLTPAKFIVQKGESVFRKTEKALLEALPQRHHVIACGGGIVTQENWKALIPSSSPIITLWANANTILKRVLIDGIENRPLINTKDPLLTIKTLLEDRKSAYQKGHWHIYTDEKTPKALVTEIIELLKKPY